MTAFFAIVVKSAIFFFFFKLVTFVLYYASNITNIFLVSSALGSLILGCFGALVQKKIKRFVAYTSINQMGFLLLGLSYSTFNGFVATMLHLLIYIFMSFGLFSFLLGVNDHFGDHSLKYISDFKLIGKNQPTAILLLTVIFFSMAGIPPLGGFFGKYFILLAGIQTNNFGLVIIALMVNLISSFYYLRLIRNL